MRRADPTVRAFHLRQVSAMTERRPGKASTSDRHVVDIPSTFGRHSLDVGSTADRQFLDAASTNARPRTAVFRGFLRRRLEMPMAFLAVHRQSCRPPFSGGRSALSAFIGIHRLFYGKYRPPAADAWADAWADGRHPDSRCPKQAIASALSEVGAVGRLARPAQEVKNKKGTTSSASPPRPRPRCPPRRTAAQPPTHGGCASPPPSRSTPQARRRSSRSSP